MNDNLQELLGETLNETQRRNIKGVWNYLTTEKGLNPRNAAAIMGNVWQESRFLPDRVSSAGATGYMQFLGQREKDYQQQLKNNKHHPEYGQFDYILYAIQDPEHKHDFYRNDYERVKKGMDLFKKQGKTKEYNEYNKYKNSVYGSREREGKLHFFSEVNDAFNNPDYKLDDLTTLWHDSIERSNPNEAKLDNRKTAANSFLKYFYKSQASYDNLINPFQKLLNRKYSTKPLFKKGGKAFVDGVNVLDSNPKAYKYVKKKYKMQNKGGLIPKAQEGTKFQNFLGKANNFLNSDVGQGLLNLVGNGLNTIKNQTKIRNFSEEFDKQTKDNLKAMKSKAINVGYQQALQMVPYILGQQTNNGEIIDNSGKSDAVVKSIAWNYANSNADQETLNEYEAQRAIQKQQAIENMTEAIQGSGTNYGKIFTNLAGQLGQYIGNKNNAPSVVTPMKDYAKDFKQKTNPSINDMNFKVAMAMKDPIYRLPNYTLPSISDYQFSWQYNK